jgi:uncharacterized protein with von Willebrand factor type A (vWA) domain
MRDYSEYIKHCFLRLRHEGLMLGMEELLDAINAIAEGFSNTDDDSVGDVLALIWCKSATERMIFTRVWSNVREDIPEEEPILSPEIDNIGSKESQINPEHMKKQEKPEQKKSSNDENLSVMPIRAPYKPIQGEDHADLKHYYPISRRFMTYTWRYLRRDIADGAEDILDYEATTEQAAVQGFFIAPVYRRQVRNHAHLVLLLDYLGSMTPFHHYLRDLVDTALYDSTLQHVEAYYFHNVPGEIVFHDPHMTQQVETKKVLASMDEFTSVLIVSDGGAARGNNDLDRIIETELFLENLYNRTYQVAWLNPMPETRWEDTSAEIISETVKMYPMNEDGMSNTLDVLRGLTRN